MLFNIFRFFGNDVIKNIGHTKQTPKLETKPKANHQSGEPSKSVSNSNPQRHKSNPSLPKKHHTLLTPTKDWIHLPLIKGAGMPREFIKEPLCKWRMIVSTTWSTEKVYQKTINHYGLSKKTTITSQVSKIAILQCFPTPKATNTRNKSTKEPGNTHSQTSHTHNLCHTIDITLQVTNKWSLYSILPDKGHTHGTCWIRDNPAPSIVGA